MLASLTPQQMTVIPFPAAVRRKEVRKLIARILSVGQITMGDISLQIIIDKKTPRAAKNLLPYGSIWVHHRKTVSKTPFTLRFNPVHHNVVMLI